VMLAAGIVATVRGRRAGAATAVDAPATPARAPGEPEWPDPTSRPWI